MRDGAQTVMYEAGGRQRYGRMFGLRQCQPEILDCERCGHAWRAAVFLDDLAAIGLVHRTVEQRVDEDVESNIWIDATLAQ